MISFDILTEESLDAVSARMGDALGEHEISGEILSSFLEVSEEGAEVAVSAAGGMMLVRIFDEGRYSFVYPIEVSEVTDEREALLALAEYTVREMVPFYLTDTPREGISVLTELFLHVDARAYDDDVDSFVAIVYSECDMIDAPPTYKKGGIILSEIREADIPRYAELCRSPEVGRYWGYDYKDDEGDAKDGAFFDTQLREFNTGLALSLAVRDENAPELLIGEGVIFDFDYRGGAKVALRILPEYQGRGIGTRAFDAMISLAREELCLRALYSEVFCENLPSIRMTEKLMPKVGEHDGKVYFALDLK